MEEIIRVFPRKTSATPDDINVRFDAPGLFDTGADEIHISVTWTDDRKRGEELYESWKPLCSNITIGGPAYNDPGGDFEPGKYVKKGLVFTSRGCPNNCWFCCVPKREGALRELEIKDGHNILDSNLLACSKEHIKKVFAMLTKQKEKPKFTGGLEAALMESWIAEELTKLKPSSAFFAYDAPEDFDPLVSAIELLKKAGYNIKSKTIQSYVLIGYKGDTFDKAEARLNAVLKLGILPQAMLFNRAEGELEVKKWRQLQRLYANKIILGSKYKQIHGDVICQH